MIENSSHLKEENVKKELQNLIERLPGKFSQKYPPYSSRPVKGKPLFVWAREGKIHEIEVPTIDVEIYSSEYLSQRSISSSDLKEEITAKINRVKGDFRQSEISTLWDSYFENNRDDLNIYRAKVTCSSGLYIRSLVHDLGSRLKSEAVTISIKRTAVGPYTLKEGQ
jgi:tRNA U55 pseudouridine synthase TruB